MRRNLFAAAILAAMPAAALAAGNCPETPKDQWLSPQEVESRLKAKGYEVRRVKREGACFEVSAKKEGKRVEAYVNPRDGAIVSEKKKDKS